jgi:ssDNA-binding Zn-finger/Zn-ribbon topoisomerase 1
MQQRTSDLQRSATEEGRQSPETPQLPATEQEIQPSDSTQQTATDQAIQRSDSPQLPVPEQESQSPETYQHSAPGQGTHLSSTKQPSKNHQESQIPDPQKGAAIQPKTHASDTPRTSTESRLVQFDTFGWPCRNPECRKLTKPYDGSTVICPRCGPYSRIRYCSKKCVFDDLLMHWGVDCGKHTLTQKADPLTIEARQINIPPFIPSLTHHDRPERHRQMVRHSLDQTADYFIFSDFVQWRADGFPGTWPATKHASGDLLVALNFAQNGSLVPAKHIFARLLRICFLVGAMRTDMTYFLFKMIQGRLYELGLATEDVKNCLIWQFKHEFGYGGGFAGLLFDQQLVSWPLVAGKIVQLEAQYRSFLSGRAGLGKEWTNEV